MHPMPTGPNHASHQIKHGNSKIILMCDLDEKTIIMCDKR